MYRAAYMHASIFVQTLKNEASPPFVLISRALFYEDKTPLLEIDLAARIVVGNRERDPGFGLNGIPEIGSGDKRGERGER